MTPFAREVAFAAAFSTALLPSCSGSEAKAPGAQLITLFDLKDALLEGRKVAVTSDFPDGFDAGNFLERKDGKYPVRAQPAFHEGKPAAFVTTEIWIGREEIWTQPGYVMVTEWSEAAPFSKVLRDPAGMRAATVFDVGADSAFYSPFWEFYYAVVPPTTPVDFYKSSVDVYNDRLPIFKGGPVLCSLSPEDVVVPDPFVHPLVGASFRGFSVSSVPAWVNGASVAYLVQGSNNYRVGAAGVVEERPMFIFVKRGGDGQVHPFGAPMVVGATPLFSGQKASAGAPMTGYTRIYLAVLPTAAAAFDTAQYPVAAAALLATGIAPGAYQGRIAVNAIPAPVMGMPPRPTCFEAATFPQSCVWLDSQVQVETQLGAANLRRTSISWTSPTVVVSDQAPKAPM